MRFQIGVLTYNAVSSLRWGLLEQTVDSLHNTFTAMGSSLPLVLDNGSEDGSDEWVRFLPRCSRAIHRPKDGNRSPGRGRNELMRALVDRPAGDIVVLSDDDVNWSILAARTLTRFWAAAPDDLAILSCLLEPDWPWNKPVGLIECGGVKALERASAPAAAWTFRLRDWDKIGPLKESLDGDGEDFDACKRLRAAGYRVAQIDLATHIGDGYSLLGNDEARGTAGRPLDLEKWGL